jgi:hypothetical protein
MGIDDLGRMSRHVGTVAGGESSERAKFPPSRQYFDRQRPRLSRGRFRMREVPVKRFLTLFSVVTLCTGALTFGQDAMKKDDSMKSNDMKSDSMKSGSMKHMKMMSAKGTVTKMDKDGKMMMMKNSKGKEMTMYWDDSTKVTGDMMEGSKAQVHYMMRDGKMMVHDVTMTSDMKDHKKM